MQDLSQRFPVWFCDVWGVLHDGIHVFAGTVDTLTRHRGQGGLVILVSNSPRTAAGVASQLAGLGVPASCYDAIVTSGDVTRTLAVQQGGGKVFHLGHERDVSIFKDSRPGDFPETRINLWSLSLLAHIPSVHGDAPAPR